MAGTRRVVIRRCAAPVDSRSPPSRSRYAPPPAGSSTARAAASGVSSARVRLMGSPCSGSAAMESVRGRGPGADPAWLTGVQSQLVEPLDVALAFYADGIVGRQSLDQAADPVPDLKREVWGRGPGEGADVLDCDPMARSHAIGSLDFAHPPAFPLVLIASPARSPRSPASRAGRPSGRHCGYSPAPPRR